MSGTSVLLDSVILIDHLNGCSAATEYLASLGPDACISAITRAEVLSGLSGKALTAAGALLDHYRFYAIDAATADLAATLRRKNHLKLPDAIQAAVAQIHGLRLATRNTRDFPPKRYRFVVVPYILPPG